MVTEDGLTVTCPAPNCMIVQENPVKPTAVPPVRVMGDAELNVMTLPSSDGVNVYPPTSAENVDDPIS